MLNVQSVYLLDFSLTGRFTMLVFDIDRCV